MFAYYIHNLVTDLETKDIDAAMIKYWEDIAIEHSKRKLRLECQTENVKLILLKIRLSLY